MVSRLVERLDGADQRCLVVERLARVGDEDGRDTEGVVDDESGRGGIPGRVAAGLECVTQSAVGEARRVGFLLYEQFAAEFLDHAAVAVVLDESVVLLGRSVGQRLEPVRVMRDPFAQGPHPHAGGNVVGDLAVDRYPVVDRVGQGLVGLLGKILTHRFPVEDVLSIKLGYNLRGRMRFGRLAVGSFLHGIKA